MVVPNPDLPTFLGDRFVATAYRTTRAILLCRHLLDLGGTFQEAPLDTPSRVVPVDPASTLAALTDHLKGLPTLPADHLTQDQVRALAIAHGYVAVQLGLEPDDPVLHWFEPDHFREFFPTYTQMMAFEAQMLRSSGRVLVRQGREAAFRRMERIFGDPSVYERKDWAALAQGYLREFAANTTADDRNLMVARLENIASRARKSLDLRLEAQCSRAVASILGLTFLDDDKKKKELFMLLAKPPERDSNKALLPDLPTTAEERP